LSNKKEEKDVRQVQSICLRAPILQQSQLPVSWGMALLSFAHLFTGIFLPIPQDKLAPAPSACVQQPLSYT